MGTLESEVLNVLWASDEPLAVREVLQRLNADRGDAHRLAYTTVMTVLARMASKGVLERERVGRGFTYRPVAPDEAALAVRKVLDQHGDAALAQFLSQAEADDDLRQRLMRIVERRS